MLQTWFSASRDAGLLANCLAARQEAPSTGTEIRDLGGGEPFGALDAITRTQIRHDLEMLWIKTRKTVWFITHSIEEAIGLSDRVPVHP